MVQKALLVPEKDMARMTAKVEKSHALGVQWRGVCEQVHAYQLVELLLPVCKEHGFELSHDINLDEEGEGITTISSPSDIIDELSQCDEEWLLVHKPGEPTENVFHVYMVFGNNADCPENGRGEMMCDWGGIEQWYEVFSPIVDAFVENKA